MDEFFYNDHLSGCRNISEKTSYLEILNYSNRETPTAETHTLSAEDFHNFLKREGVFEPGVGNFKNGTRLVLQLKAEDPHTFSPQVISFETDQYKALIREMHLPFRWLETSSAVGSFFWWKLDDNDGDSVLQLVFRKSDVSWNGFSRGWEMALSYSFKTRITSGFVKGTASAKLEKIIKQLIACASPDSHPLLLPLLILNNKFSTSNDQEQRESRDKLRQLEKALSRRYQMAAAPGYVASGDVELDSINRDLTDYHCQALWKRPQAWLNVVNRMQEAMKCFWDNLPVDAGPNPEELRKLHNTILCRLNFLAIKLDGLEHYSHVTIERLKLQREVMHSILDQRESRLSLELAIQQQRMADSSRRDSISVKTLTLMGSVFLPGAFMSSLFSTTFFDFGIDMNGPVSTRLWIYFIVTVPLTAVIVCSWFHFDKKLTQKVVDDNATEVDVRMHQLERRITERIGVRTGARVRTWDMNETA
ncbi:hypothetical protein B0H63DRAFT_463294 [Podospora didyma]|uniref:Uncharacterized protein n=1 Tax=Podospora didyma TaxID=330526 RepID=A0AAE0NX54_9PEZI|nr:hypothetical protein B0H63DRAFT_463294 [Podospora didyma]